MSAADRELRILFVGAGAVNFGGAEGPWDHSSRLERLGGVRVVAIADPDLPKARRVLDAKSSGPRAHVYEGCQLFASCDEAIASCEADVAFIGVPPFAHGAANPPCDIELRCLEAGLHLFLEKPISVQPPEELASYVDAVEASQRSQGLVVSVGYMFRYHPAVEKMKQVLVERGCPVMAINATYNCTYAALDHPFWWNKARSGGPIVEQATHFCDLFRFLGGELEGSVAALAVPPSDSPGQAGYLSRVPEVVKETSLPMEHRIPRVTTAHWRLAGGGVACLTHAAALQGRRYEAGLEVWADGLRMSLEEAYWPQCRLRIRSGNTDEEEVLSFPGADPYLEEVKAFLEAVRSGRSDHVRSSYRDAAQTYRLSWAIRRASEVAATVEPASRP